MAQTGFPFEGQSTTETEYGQLASQWQDSGVIGEPGGTALQVTADSSGMHVDVDPGPAVLRGTFYDSDAAEQVGLSDADGSLARVDLVVVRMDPTTDSSVLAAVEGTPGAGPPSLTQTPGGVYELELARVTAGAGAVTVANADITDRRTFVGQRTGLWRSSTRPLSPPIGRLGWNVTLTRWEYWDGSSWVPLIPGTVDNATRWDGLRVTVSETDPGDPSSDHIWIQPIN